MTLRDPSGHAFRQLFDHGEQWSRLSTLRPAAPTERHGTSAAYNRGCRCETCVTWRRQYDRARYDRLHPSKRRRLADAEREVGRLRWSMGTIAKALDIIVSYLRDHDDGMSGDWMSTMGVAEHSLGLAQEVAALPPDRVPDCP